MSDYIDTREGWREVSPDHRPAGPGEFLIYDGATNRAWFREEPVPPLPAEPYTVISAAWNGPRGVSYPVSGVLIFRGGGWFDVSTGEQMCKHIIRFKVLAEPHGSLSPGDMEAHDGAVRRETAEDVIDWFAKNVPLTAVLYQGAVREFGVSDG